MAASLQNYISMTPPVFTVLFAAPLILPAANSLF